MVMLAMGPGAFETWLLEANRDQLEQGCMDPAIGLVQGRRQQIRERLLALHSIQPTVDAVMAYAMALLRCGSPDSALAVLQRINPESQQDRQQWLLLRWRAANAGLNHREAALALRLWANGNLPALAELALEPGLTGMEQLAEHEAAMGRNLVAAELLLMVPSLVPHQLSRAAEWLALEDSERADALLEAALDQAAADQAWGLAVELLQQQLRLQRAAGLSGDRPRQRLQRLTAQIDDRYSQWQLGGAAELDPLLRSPRQPGGHAAVGDSTDASLP